MKILEFQLDRSVEYIVTGKFEAPSSNWIHEDFNLVDYELIVMTAGTLYLSYNGHDYTVGSNEFLLLPPKSPPFNRRKGFRPSDCSFYWLHFEAYHPLREQEISSGSIMEYYEGKPASTVSIPVQGVVANQEKVIVLMKQLQNAVRENYPHMSLNYMATVVLCEIYSQFFPATEFANKSKKTQKQIYHDIMDYVRRNVHRNLKVADVAAHFGYNEKYLSHLFGKIASITLKQYILNVKMDTANFLLTDTNKSVREIASELGFTDSHNFTKAYKKISGLTPTEYRNAFSKRLLYHV